MCTLRGAELHWGIRGALWPQFICACETKMQSLLDSTSISHCIDESTDYTSYDVIDTSGCGRKDDRKSGRRTSFGGNILVQGQAITHWHHVPAFHFPLWWHMRIFNRFAFEMTSRDILLHKAYQLANGDYIQPIATISTKWQLYPTNRDYIQPMATIYLANWHACICAHLQVHMFHYLSSNETNDS